MERLLFQHNKATKNFSKGLEGEKIIMQAHPPRKISHGE